MARYRSGVPSNATATSAAVRYELRAGARPCYVRELYISNEAATVITVLGHRALAIGVTPTSPVSLVPENDINAVASLAQTAIAWGTAPTVPSTSPLFRVGLPAVIGASWAISFQAPGLYLAVNASLILVNNAASSSALLGVSAVIDD